MSRLYATGGWSSLAVWYAAARVKSDRHPELSRCLLMDGALERSGRTLNISISGNAQAICSMAEQVTGYCAQNGMDGMRISLAMEELMTLTVQENEGERSSLTCACLPCRIPSTSASAATAGILTPAGRL